MIFYQITKLSSQILFAKTYFGVSGFNETQLPKQHTKLRGFLHCGCHIFTPTKKNETQWSMKHPAIHDKSLCWTESDVFSSTNYNNLPDVIHN